MTEGDLIRAFPASDLRQSIDKALLAVPPGDNVAVIAYANLDGAKLAAFARLPGGFSFVGVLEHKWKGELKAEAALAWSR